MDNHGRIKAMYNEGKRVRDEIEKMTGRRQEKAEYASSGEKRTSGVAYRLLNAAKAGNKKQFLDTVTRLYLQIKKPIPGLFLNVLHEEKLDFGSVSGAFITGLLSRENSMIGNDENEGVAANSEKE